ncbi:MAG: hypothetical protein MI861_17105 [Pirellulales bacterium]|nr:hypothetical protein [Pirellulales bacterium]
MGSESGFAVEEVVPPLRPSGFVSLVLGLLSPVSLVGAAALLVPLGAILFGLFALRRQQEAAFASTIAAKVGLVLAFGFGSCGLFVPIFKNRTLGSQAEQFARHYIELVAMDETELAMELRKDYNNRFPGTMPLKAHYSLNESSEDAMLEFRNEGTNRRIRERGPGAEWKLERPVRVFTHYQIQRAELFFIDPTGKSSLHLYILMQYDLDHRNGDGQWYVVQVQEHMEPIFAPSIL